MCLVRVRNLEVCPDVYASQTLCGTSVYASQLYQISALQDLRQRKWWGMSILLKEGEIIQAITWSCGQSIQHLSQWHWFCLESIPEHIKIFFQDYIFFNEYSEVYPLPPWIFGRNLWHQRHLGCQEKMLTLVELKQPEKLQSLDLLET